MTREDELKLKQVSDAFNSMPFEYRDIASNAETATRVLDLLRLKKRITENYNREVKYINESIKRYLQSIKL